MKSVSVLLFLIISIAVGPLSSAQDTNKTGVLVMAHGGGEQWNDAVRDAVQPISRQYPVTIAFGMADPVSLQSAVDSLESRGVNRIAVVRLFLSGDSFLEETQELFGLGAHPAVSGADSVADGEVFASQELDFHCDIALSRSGLLDSDRLQDIIQSRVLAMSRSPEEESILLLAHGPGDDLENEHWITLIEHHARKTSDIAPFHAIRVETLREDWPEKREEAEKRIRGFVRAETDAGRTVLVVPVRLFGFGPYEEVLQGLKYRAKGIGLLPHEAITEWIRDEVRSLDRTNKSYFLPDD